MVLVELVVETLQFFQQLHLLAVELVEQEVQSQQHKMEALAVEEKEILLLIKVMETHLQLVHLKEMMVALVMDQLQLQDMLAVAVVEPVPQDQLLPNTQQVVV